MRIGAFFPMCLLSLPVLSHDKSTKSSLTLCARQRTDLGQNNFKLSWSFTVVLRKGSFQVITNLPVLSFSSFYSV